MFVKVTHTSQTSLPILTENKQHLRTENSATKQHLHLQSVAEKSHHSVLSGDRIRKCETSSGSRHKDTDQCLQVAISFCRHSVPVPCENGSAETTVAYLFKRFKAKEAAYCNVQVKHGCNYNNKL